jgi:hypothetical protein
VASSLPYLTYSNYTNVSSQLIAGFIIQSLGFKFTFGICGLIYAGIIPAMYFFVPESLYFAPIAKTEVIFDKASLRVYEIIIPETKKSYSHRLKVSQGRVSSLQASPSYYIPSCHL